MEEDASHIRLKTLIEVARILPNDATVTQAECTAAVEAAKAVCCLARTGSICFDLDVKLIEDCIKKQEEEEKRRNGRKL